MFLRVLCVSILAVLDELIQVYPEESISVADVTTVDKKEAGRKIVVEEIQMEERHPQEITLPQPMREIEDDWFVVLDITPRVPSVIPSGISKVCFASHQFPSILKTIFLCFVW